MNKPNHLSTTASAVFCLSLLVPPSIVTGQEISPVWVQHLNLPNNSLPILRKADGPTELADGTSSFDNYAAFVRYDSTRLLLGIRENGINETTASPADLALAAQYPDRSIIWINAATGAPLGIAHQMPVFPVTLEDGTQSSPNDFFWNWGIADGPEGQRPIYSTYKNVILRWAPLAAGGWSNTPTVAWIEPVPGIGDGSSGGDGSLSWRWRTFRVSGSGANTAIYAGGATWRMSMHVQKFTTADGLTFTPVARVNDRDGGIKNRYSWSGMNTKPVKFTGDPARPNLELLFSPSFPAAGRDLKPRRYSRNPDSLVEGSFTEVLAGAPQFNRRNFFDVDHAAAGGLPAFEWEGPEAPFPSGTEYYDGNWSYAMDSDTGLDYVVNYSGPSWNNQYGPDERRPGWLGVHRLGGDIASGLSSYKLDFNEVTEVTLDNVNTGNSYTYDGNVTVYRDPNSPANLQRSEVLWSGGSFGFGVFTVQNVAATLVTSPTNQTVAAGETLVLSAAVTGSPNSFQWYRNGRPLPRTSYYQGVHKSTLTITGATPADAGTYQLRWNNPISGAGQTATATVVVNGSFTRWTNVTEIPPRSAESITVESTLEEKPASFVMKAGGLGAWDSVVDGLSSGDTLYYRYETLTGDFDRAVRLVGLSTDPEPSSTSNRNARAGLLLRQSLDPAAPALEIAAFNPFINEQDPSANGANMVRVAGRGHPTQIYSQRLSRAYGGVAANLPNQWLRMRRTGNAFAFFVSTNGTTWSLIGEQYQIFPATILFGTFALPDDAAASSVAIAEFAGYGPVATAETVPPLLLSAGTIDLKTIGLKFSEPVDSLVAENPANYLLSQGSVTGARLGISGNTVYLTAAGVTSDSFTVTVNNIVDLSGNPVAPGSQATVRKTPWISTDIGFIQDPDNRPTIGDDPYLPGQAVAVSSESNPEFEIVGGGSNAYNPGDFIHYLHRPFTGDFDVAVAVDRFDRRGIAGGYSNAGLHIRAGLYRDDIPDVAENTKVPSYVNITYYEASDPNRASIELNRPNAGDNYGNSGPYDNNTNVNGLLGYFSDLRATNAEGTLDPLSHPAQAKWLRVKRVGQNFTSYFSYDGLVWLEQAGSTRLMENLPNTVLIGFGNQNDSGYGIPPNANTYNGNGSLDENGLPVQNASNYGVLRIRSFGPLSSATPTLTITDNEPYVTLSWPGAGFTLEQSPNLATWTPSTLPFTATGGTNLVHILPGATPLYFRLSNE